MNIKTIVAGVLITVLSVGLAMGISYLVTRTDQMQITAGTPEQPQENTPQVGLTTNRPVGMVIATQQPTSSFNCTFPMDVWLDYTNAWRITSYRIADRLYTRTDMRDIMLAGRDDTRSQLLVQIFLTVLNQQNGADATSIRIPFNEALNWLSNFPPGSTPSDGDLQKAELITATLGRFNNGEYGSPRCTYNLAIATADLSTLTAEPSPTATFYRSVITRFPPTRTNEPRDPKPTRKPPTSIPPTSVPLPTNTSEPLPTKVPTDPPSPTNPPPDTPEPTVASTQAQPPPGLVPPGLSPTPTPEKKKKKSELESWFFQLIGSAYN